MTSRSRDWMWAEAVDLIDKVQRLQQQAFAPMRGAQGAPVWEPPVDMLETATELRVLVALPGVDAERTEAFIEDGVLIVRGFRVLPPELQHARIHRLELPQGRFERRLALPAGRYDGVRRSEAQGCLLVTLHKVGGQR